MRSQISNYVTSVFNRDSDTDNNMIQLLKNENSRLESKLMLLQSEFIVEKTKADQIKEVTHLSYNCGETELKYLLRRTMNKSISSPN